MHYGRDGSWRTGISNGMNERRHRSTKRKGRAHFQWRSVENGMGSCVTQLCCATSKPKVKTWTVGTEMGPGEQGDRGLESLGSVSSRWGLYTATP
ncbi:uncharacterized protein STEHIDRAFT_123677 [Stereum hirsutum FP-91666 SS1]|uniref:uncharacterized protein n=1 Tax=Stereum hirsutum (strain FP-91666) TaxID=721885 RepID=UPI000444A5A1|nr:uncharacterized protein STEHIDRAFT_123677 [Stereum hirsutum FP-91666 SS1]EIM83223.1 hypothetical protein STEHIDRAFT_123677 [Stereum hirsutum FP-91666 SS1]